MSMILLLQCALSVVLEVGNSVSVLFLTKIHLLQEVMEKSSFFYCKVILVASVICFIFMMLSVLRMTPISSPSMQCVFLLIYVCVCVFSLFKVTFSYSLR